MSVPNLIPYRRLTRKVLVRGPLAQPEMVRTAHGDVQAERGDFVITDPGTGDTWPIKQHFLAANYTPIDPDEEVRFKTMRATIFSKIAELATIALRGTPVDPNQVDTLLREYGEVNRRAGAESSASQMRASFSALADHAAGMRDAGHISPTAQIDLQGNINVLMELFAPGSDTRRAVVGYTNGHRFDWEDNVQ